MSNFWVVSFKGGTQATIVEADDRSLAELLLCSVVDHVLVVNEIGNSRKIDKDWARRFMEDLKLKIGGESSK